MKIKSIYVNNENETFAILTAAQALDLLYCNDGPIETMGSHIDGIFYMDEDNRRIEFFRDNGYQPFEEFYQRLDDLKACGYTNTTDFHDNITE